MRGLWVWALVLMASVSIAHAEEFLIPDLKWMVLQSDNVGPALYAPKEQDNPFEQFSNDYWSYELGRIAFRSPTLLGGLAAREGMSCHSCHQSGGSNPHFFVAGLSSTPGTFDPTNSLFSIHTEDNIDNPVPIPSLFSVAETAPYPSDERFATLDQMVTHVIEEEFDGLTPPPKIKQSLLDYLSALETPETFEMVAITPNADLSDFMQMVSLLAQANNEKDKAVSQFLANTARRKLELIHNRYPNSADIRQRLVNWSAILREARELVDEGQFEKANAHLVKIEVSVVMSSDFNEAMPGSLYEEETLKKYVLSLQSSQ